MTRGAGDKLVGAIVRKLEERQQNAHKESMNYGALNAATQGAPAPARRAAVIDLRA
jgi:hypothetical protein